MEKADDELPFWQRKTLSEMTEQEWESLCDGCGRCCMHKLEDEDSGDIYATSVACQLLSCETCQCRDYQNRKALVPDCIQLTLDIIQTVRWLPDDCAYRLIHNGKDLKWWHHLVSGSYQTVHDAGISMRDKVEAFEDELKEPEDYLKYVKRPIYRNKFPRK